jgi:GAF domain-containing protein
MNVNGWDTSTDPLKERDRLLEIAELGLDDPEVDQLLQNIAREAAEYFDLPIGVVSVVLDEAQWFAAMHGVGDWVGEARGTPVEWSFCRNVVREAAEFVVEDAREHEVMKDSPLVQIDGLRCYAGIPMVTSRGHVIGSFCVKGTEVRSFSEEDMVVLRKFAKRAVDRIEARRPATV